MRGPGSLAPKSAAEKGENACSVCSDEDEQGDNIRVLPCGHTFPSHCIFP